jgi:hypothetical protein
VPSRTVLTRVPRVTLKRGGEEEKEETGEARGNLIEGPLRELDSQRSDYHFTGIACPAIGWRHDHLNCSNLR